MLTRTFEILLVDDDADDCMFFEEALRSISKRSKLTIVRDGEQLITLLNTVKILPEILFLDLNMPLKNGFECLEEIKANKKLSALPVVIMSTSFDPAKIANLHKKGAVLYIRKPSNFSELEKVIQYALTFATKKHLVQPAIELFVITGIKDGK